MTLGTSLGHIANYLLFCLLCTHPGKRFSHQKRKKKKTCCLQDLFLSFQWAVPSTFCGVIARIFSQNAFRMAQTQKFQGLRWRDQYHWVAAHTKLNCHSSLLNCMSLAVMTSTSRSGSTNSFLILWTVLSGNFNYDDIVGHPSSDGVNYHLPSALLR